MPPFPPPFFPSRSFPYLSSFPHDSPFSTSPPSLSFPPCHRVPKVIQLGHLKCIVSSPSRVLHGPWLQTLFWDILSPGNVSDNGFCCFYVEQNVVIKGICMLLDNLSKFAAHWCWNYFIIDSLACMDCMCDCLVCGCSHISWVGVNNK